MKATPWEVRGVQEVGEDERVERGRRGERRGPGGKEGAFSRELQSQEELAILPVKHRPVGKARLARETKAMEEAELVQAGRCGESGGDGGRGANSSAGCSRARVLESRVRRARERRGVQRVWPAERCMVERDAMPEGTGFKEESFSWGDERGFWEEGVG